METIFAIAAVVAVAVIAGAIFSPRFRQALRIWGDKGLSKTSTPVERAKDRVKQAIDKLPTQRELVARLMTAADNASAAVTDKEAEADRLLTKYQTAVTAKATPETQNTLKLQWKRAKDAVPTLREAAVAAQSAAADAQAELEGFIELIQTSQDGVAQLESDANLAAILRETTAFRQRVNDLKSGLGDMAADQKAVKDELATARNASELSKGSAAEREMQQIERQVQVNDADAEIAAALAERAAKQGK